MRKTLFLVSIISLLIFSACNSGTNNGNTSDQDSSIVETDDIPMLSIITLDENAEQYVDKKIKVAGTVSHICKHGGKKMHLFEAPVDSITVTVITGESFDADLEGSDVIVTGMMKEERITAEEINGMEEEYRIECDGSIVKEDAKNEGNNGNNIEKKEQIDYYKELLEESGKGYISFFSIEFIELEKK